jgi:hypothetical protein
MSAEVAPQGIAQDLITLAVAVPLLLLALRASLRAGSIRARLLLAGVMMYFAVTYLFYLTMAMFNLLFLAYTALLGLSAFALGMTLLGLEARLVRDAFEAAAPLRGAGTFLVVTTSAIALLWLSIVVPPLFDGSIVPRETEHYTTLIVQGLDLGLLLPLGFVTGLQMRRRTPFGTVVGPVYLVFLAVLMTALTAKVIAMAQLGHNVIPVILIIPATAVAAAYLAVRVLRGLRVS